MRKNHPFPSQVVVGPGGDARETLFSCEFYVDLGRTYLDNQEDEDGVCQVVFDAKIEVKSSFDPCDTEPRPTPQPRPKSAAAAAARGSGRVAPNKRSKRGRAWEGKG